MRAQHGIQRIGEPAHRGAGVHGAKQAFERAQRGTAGRDKAAECHRFARSRFARSRFFVHIAAAQAQRETGVLKFNFPAPILVIAIGYGQTVLGQFGGKPLGEFLGSVDIRLARRFFE